MARRILHEISLTKIAAVDQPCQAHAKVSIMKRAPRRPTEQAIAKATFAEALAGQLLADKVCDIFYRAFDNQYAANSAFKKALIDDLVSGGDGTTPSSDYVAAMGVMASNAVAAARDLGAGATDAQLESIVEKAIKEFTESKQETTEMIITTKAALLAAVAKFNPAVTTVAEVQEIQKAAKQFDAVAELPAALAPVDDASDVREELAKMKALADLTPAEKAQYDKLDAAGKKAFLAKSAPERAAELDAIEKGDPIVYTMADGTAVRKSAGDFALMMAKRFDEQEKVNKALQANAAGDEIAKAVQLYPNVAKSLVTTMTKSVQNGTPEEKADVTAALNALNKKSAGLFKRVGSTDASEATETGDEPIGKMKAIVKRVMAEKKLSEPLATVDALTNDPEYQQLYAESLESVPAVGAAR